MADEPIRRCSSGVTQCGDSHGRGGQGAGGGRILRQGELEAGVLDPRDLDRPPGPAPHGRQRTTTVRTPPGRFGAMCGRFVSATPPDQVAAYFGAEAPEALLEPSLERRPDRRRVRRARRREHPAPRRLPLGPRAPLGQGPEDRVADDQRPGRDPGHQERLQVGLPAAALHHPGRRVLRVAEAARARRPSSRTSSTGPTASPTPSPGSGRSGRGPTAGATSPCGRARSSRPRPTRTMAKIHDRMPVILPAGRLGHLARPRAAGPRPARPSSWCPAPPQLITLRPISTAGEQRPQRRPRADGRGRAAADPGRRLGARVDHVLAVALAAEGGADQLGVRRRARRGPGWCPALAKLICAELGERHQVHVGVRHLLADHEHADPARAGTPPGARRPIALATRHRSALRSSGRSIQWSTGSMGTTRVWPGARAAIGEERHDPLVPPHEAPGELTVDDAGEDRRHADAL